MFGCTKLLALSLTRVYLLNVSFSMFPKHILRSLFSCKFSHAGGLHFLIIIKVIVSMGFLYLYVWVFAQI